VSYRDTTWRHKPEDLDLRVYKIFCEQLISSQLIKKFRVIMEPKGSSQKSQKPNIYD